MHKPIRSKTPTRMPVYGAIFCVALALAALILSRCTLVPLSGGGTEGGNVTGLLADPNGSQSAQAQVQLIPSFYDPVTANQTATMYTAVTASDGSYSFLNVPAGTYTIQAVSLNRRARALITGITVIEDKEVLVTVDTLEKPGTMKIFLPKAVDLAAGYLYVPGTTMKSMIGGADGFVIIDSVPAGTIPVIYYATRNAPATDTIRFDIEVPSGDTATIAYPEWKYAKRIFLNTTSGGAGVAGTVIGFPLLVRLNGNNFNFSRAQSNGKDLLFSKADYVSLPFEIERWDPAFGGTGLAEIWVKVDTVFGNDSSHSITMYWGNPSSTGASNRTAVFDTTNGFRAAWHLQDQDTKTAIDASIGNNHGINYGATDTAGIIGNAKRFTTKDSIVIPGLMNSLQTISLSAWVNIDSLRVGSYGGDVLSLGDAVFIRVDEKNNGVMGGFHQTDTLFRNVASGRFLGKTGWHHLAFTYDGNNRVQTLFIDGVASKTEAFTDPIDYSGVGKNTLIGAHGNGKKSLDFKGAIDEVRVYGTVASSDWIKLCFMNQRADDKLVVFLR